jgi:hypothetical protein
MASTSASNPVLMTMSFTRASRALLIFYSSIFSMKASNSFWPASVSEASSAFWIRWKSGDWKKANEALRAASSRFFSRAVAAGRSLVLATSPPLS